MYLIIFDSQKFEDQAAEELMHTSHLQREGDEIVQFPASLARIRQASLAGIPFEVWRNGDEHPFLVHK